MDGTGIFRPASRSGRFEERCGLARGIGCLRSVGECALWAVAPTLCKPARGVQRRRMRPVARRPNPNMTIKRKSTKSNEIWKDLSGCASHPALRGPCISAAWRTALYNWPVRSRHGGTMILRIEDTDSQRFVPGAEGISSSRSSGAASRSTRVSASAALMRHTARASGATST